MRKLFVVCILVSFSMFVYAVDFALGSDWKITGPYGGSVRGLAASRKNSSHIYALTAQRLFRSVNSGSSWTETGFFEVECFDVQVAPSDPKTIYVLSHTGLFRTSDAGTSWAWKSFEPNFFSYGEIAVHPEDADIVYIGGYQRNLKKNSNSMALMKFQSGGDKGDIKTILSGSDDSYVTNLIIDPKSPRILYAAGYTEKNKNQKTGVIRRSSDGGLSWKDITGSIYHLPQSIAIDPRSTNNIYVATLWNVYRSANAGDTWKKNEDIAYGYAVAVDQMNPNNIYAGFSEVCYKSRDGGVTWWKYRANIEGDCQDLLALSSKVYFASESGIYRSTDSGHAWSPKHKNISAHKILSIAGAPSDPSILYASTGYGGLYRSTSSGKSWSRAPGLANCDHVVSAVVNPENPRDVFCLTTGSG